MKKCDGRPRGHAQGGGQGTSFALNQKNKASGGAERRTVGRTERRGTGQMTEGREEEKERAGNAVTERQRNQD